VKICSSLQFVMTIPARPMIFDLEVSAKILQEQQARTAFFDLGSCIVGFITPIWRRSTINGFRGYLLWFWAMKL